MGEASRKKISVGKIKDTFYRLCWCSGMTARETINQHSAVGFYTLMPILFDLLRVRRYRGNWKIWHDTWLQHTALFSLLMALQFFYWGVELPLAGFWTQAFISQGKDQDLKPLHQQHALFHFQEKKYQCLSLLLIAAQFLFAYTSKCFQILP